MKLRTALLGGVAAGTLFAGASSAAAEEFTWAGPDKGHWDVTDHWTVEGEVAIRLPSVGDVIAFNGLQAEIYGEHAADALDLQDGTVWVNTGGVLNLGELNVDGGRLAMSTAKNGLPAGRVNVGGDVTLSAGMIDRYGLIWLDEGGVFTQSGGLLNQSVRVEAPTYVQTGGEMAGTVTTPGTYEHSGGTMGGTVIAHTYSLDGSGAVMSGTVDASTLFRLRPDSDVVVDGRLTGTGVLVKSGSATVTLTSEHNDFAGEIRVEAGVLEYTEGWHARTGDVIIDANAVLRSLGGSDTNFRGGMTGDGWFEQASGGQFGIGEGVELGGLKVTSGTFRVGTAYFDTDDGTGHGGSAEASFGTVQLGGTVPDGDGDDINGLGVIEVERGSSFTAGLVELTAGSLSEAPAGDPELPAGAVHADRFNQSGGRVAGLAISAGTYDYSGGELAADVSFSELFKLSGDGHVTTALIGDGDAAIEQSGGHMEGAVSGVATYTQSGGVMASHLTGLARYTQSGGSIEGLVETVVYELADGTGEDFDKVTIGNELVLSGGTLARAGLVLPVFTQSGGAFTGDITVDSYNMTGTGGTFTGVINAAETFNLAPDSATTMDARLTGTAGLVKDGTSTVTLSHAGNDFTGTVAINAGVLEAIDDALPDGADVTVASGAALQLTTHADTLFTGSMTGAEGDLIKAGTATATLSGNVDLGDLWLDAGRLNIGTGTSTNEAVFDSATIAVDSTLYIASGATLTIRIPKHIINNGTLINDGTVHDDLDNNGAFVNNMVYNADVATNAGTVNNNTPGYWTGNIESNAGTIVNHDGATWDGAVEGNTGNITNDGVWLNGTVTNGTAGVNPGLDYAKVIYNNFTATWNGDIAENYSWILNEGGTWNGDVLSNHREIWNDNRYGEIGIGYWVGDIVRNDGSIFNGGGGDWTGDVLGNARTGYIKNDALAVWTGNIYGNDGGVENRGLWTGDVAGNSYVIYNSKTWNGAIIAAGTVTSAETGNVPNIGNTGIIFNATVGSAWIGDVGGNAGTIINGTGSSWTGDVLANTGTIMTTGLWTGDITSSGSLRAGGSISGAVDTTGTLALIGDLTVGSISFGDEAFFDVDLDAAGEGEALTVTGAAHLDGTVRIKAGPAMTGSDFLVPYTLVTAGSITGAFDDVTTDLAFLTPVLDYTATTAAVTLARNWQSFAGTAITGNQRAVAMQIEALGGGNALYDAILWLTQEQAQAAFDQVSGEVYASADAATRNNATLIGSIALNRLDQALGGTLFENAAHGAGLWTQVYGTSSSAQGPGAAGMAGSSGGAAIGLDGLAGDWRVGFMLHAGTETTTVSALDSSVTGTGYGIGLYGGTRWGGTQLALAGTYTRHDNASTRGIDFMGFAEKLSAEYATGTAQVAGKLSHEFDLGAMSFTPYASAAYVNQATSGFSETGGAAALTRAAGTSGSTFATIGAAVDYEMLVHDGVLLTGSASLGLRRAFADAPDARLALPGGVPMSVMGSSASGDTAVIAAGLNLDLNATTALHLDYDGQAGAASQAHALTGTWAGKF